MDKLYNEFTNDDLILQRRIVKGTKHNTKKVVGHIYMDLKMKNLWIAMSVQIRIIVAGDEKLWRFTGNNYIRLCISKPDKVGFWFYELCARLSNGLPYMLSLLMHNSTEENVKVVDIVKG